MSFEGLIRKLSPTLKRITRKLNGHYSYFDDEDLYQEALARLWIDFREGVLKDKTDSYILQGCYFHLKNHLRKVEERVCLVSLNAPAADEGFVLEEVLPDDRDSFEQLEGRLQVEALKRAYLTARETEVLSLTLEGMTMREIGERVGISHVMVLKIRNRIRDKYVRFSSRANN
jgi:RNA polymerase sigma factor (sigma-70 family)